MPAAPTQSEASPAQLEAGNYRKPKRKFQGLTISIENRKGSTRSGVDRDGHRWSTKMRADYGYVKGSLGVDGDHVDCYIGPDKDAAFAYVVHQRKAGDWKAFDEDKVMLGYPSKAKAVAAYLAHYDDPRFLGPVTEMPMDEFKRKVLSSREKPQMIKSVLLFLKAKRPDARGTDDMFAALADQAVQVKPHYDKHGRFIPGHTSTRKKRVQGPKLPTRADAVASRVPDLFGNGGKDASRLQGKPMGGVAAQRQHERHESAKAPEVAADSVHQEVQREDVARLRAQSAAPEVGGVGAAKAGSGAIAAWAKQNPVQAAEWDRLGLDPVKAPTSTKNFRGEVYSDGGKYLGDAYADAGKIKIRDRYNAGMAAVESSRGFDVAQFKSRAVAVASASGKTVKQWMFHADAPKAAEKPEAAPVVAKPAGPARDYPPVSEADAWGLIPESKRLQYIRWLGFEYQTRDGRPNVLARKIAAAPWEDVPEDLKQSRSFMLPIRQEVKQRNAEIKRRAEAEQARASAPKPERTKPASLDYNPDATENTFAGITFELIRTSGRGGKYWRVRNKTVGFDIEEAGGGTFFSGDTKAEKWASVADTLRRVGEDKFRRDLGGDKPAKPFTPTHEAADGAPLMATAEAGVYLDADGFEVEDDYAKPIKVPATERLRQSLPPDAPPAIAEAIGKVESSQHNLAALHEAKADPEEIKDAAEELKAVTAELSDGVRSWQDRAAVAAVEDKLNAAEAGRTDDGPREGDRNAEGLVFRDGRWHRDGAGEVNQDPKDAALQAAVDHLKEDAKQGDLPAKEKREDAALVAKLEGAIGEGKLKQPEPAPKSTLTPREQQALTHAENMVKPGVVTVASKLRNELKISGTLQAMVAMSTGKIPEAAELTTQERATAAWMAEHTDMTHRGGKRESAERPGWAEYYDVPVTQASDVGAGDLQPVLFDAVGLDKSAPYYTPGFSEQGLIGAAIQIDTGKHRSQLARLAATVKQWVENRPLVERGKRLLSGSAFTDPATWGDKAKVMAEIVSDGLLSKDQFARALERDLKIQPALKKELAAGAPTLDEILSGSRSLNELIALRLVGSTNQAKINAYAHDLQRLRAALHAVPPKPDGSPNFDAESNAYKAAGFTYLRNHTSAFNRKKVYAVQTPSGGIIELGLMSFSGDMDGLFKLPKEPGGWHADLKSRASAIMTFLAESGYLRKATEDEVNAAEPKPARPAPVRKEVVYKKPRETKETRKPAHLFYGEAGRGEKDGGGPEIAKRMREDIKRGVAAGRIPKGMKISVTSDHSSIDIRVRGVPKGMPTHNPDWLVAFANHGWNLEYADDDVAREIGKLPRDIPRYSPELTRVLDDVKAIHGKYNWDKSDIMSDYFSKNYYGDASIDLDAALDVVPKPSSATLGDTITLDGNTYRLEGEPPRWHKVRGQESAKAAQGPKETEASRKARAAKLKARAEKVIADTEAEIGRDRRSNTPKRAREAAGMIERAMRKQAQGETLSAIADAIAAGEAPHLAKVSALTDVELLEDLLSDARHRHYERAGIDTWTKRKDRMGEAPDPAAVDHAFYPLVNREHAEWSQERTIQKQDRLRRLGVTDDDSLRAALSEYLGVRSGPKKEDPVKVAERALVGQKVGIDFFPTPKPLAAQMAQMAGIKPGMRVLEPSAGNGHLADAARAAGAQVDTVEISDTLRNILKAKGHAIVAHDFMALEPGESYDAILMNPPFSKRMDARHVMRAWEHLAPGGTLVAITGEGVHFGRDQAAQDFRDWLDANGAEVENLPEGTFKGADLPAETGVNARIIVLRKPAAMSKAIFVFPSLRKVARNTKLSAQH